MKESKKEISDQILDLLLDALQARQQGKLTTQETKSDVLEPTLLKERIFEEQEEIAAAKPSHWQLGSLLVKDEETAVLTTSTQSASSSIQPLPSEDDEQSPQLLPDAKKAVVENGETAVFGDHLPAPPTFINLEHTLGRIIFALILLVVAVNIPFNRFGTNLARAMPDSAALVIRDGLLLTDSGEKVYVLENNQLRWITTLDAFEWYGYRWENVHQVETSFLTQFEEGSPIHLLLKCDGSEHVYGVEDGKKRWIKDILTFTSLGYDWEQIRPISCGQLERLPNGLPIPEDAGEPPA